MLGQEEIGFIEKLKQYGHHSQEELELIQKDLEKGYPLKCVMYYAKKDYKNSKYDYMKRVSGYVKAGVREVEVLELLDECQGSDEIIQYILVHSKESASHLREVIHSMREEKVKEEKEEKEETEKPKKVEKREEQQPECLPVLPDAEKRKQEEAGHDGYQKLQQMLSEKDRLIQKKDELLLKKDERIERLEDQKAALMTEKEELLEKFSQKQRNVETSFLVEEKETMVKQLAERDEKIQRLTINEKTLQAEKTVLEEQLKEIRSDYEKLRASPMDEIKKHNGLIELFEQCRKENEELKKQIKELRNLKSPSAATIPERNEGQSSLGENEDKVREKRKEEVSKESHQEAKEEIREEPGEEMTEKMQPESVKQADTRMQQVSKKQAEPKMQSASVKQADIGMQQVSANKADIKKQPVSVKQPEKPKKEAIDYQCKNQSVETSIVPKRNFHQKAFLMKFLKPESFMGIMLRLNASPEQMKILHNGMENGLSLKQVEQLLESGKSGEVLEHLVKIGIFDSKRRG